MVAVRGIQQNWLGVQGSQPPGALLCSGNSGGARWGLTASRHEVVARLGGRGQPLEGAGGIWECMVGLERSNGWEKGHKGAW